MSIGARIKQFRNQKGLTQVKLATNAGISRSYLADVEANRYNPSLATLIELAQALGIAVSCFLDDQEIDTGNKAISIPVTSSNEVEPTQSKHIPPTIAVHFENTVFTEEETKEIDDFISFLTSRRSKQP